MHFFLSIFTGNVMSHHKTIKDLEKYYSKLSENQDYKKFLNNITSDKEGYGLLLMILDSSQVYLISILNQLILNFSAEFYICSHGRELLMKTVN